MKLIKEVRQVGTGNPVPSASVFVYSWPEGLGVGAIPTDADGLGVIVVQGAPGAVVVHAERGAATYDDYSESIQPAGQFDLDMLRTRLANLVTDGIVATYGNVFRLTVGSGSITLSSGGVVLDGILALFAISTTIPVTNGDRAVVAVLSGDAVSLTEIAYSSIVAGTHVPLYRYTVSAGSVVTSSITDIGRLAGPRAGRKTQIGIARLASGSTLNNSGEIATGLSTTLELEAATYDIQSRVTAVGRGRDGALALDLGAGVGTYRSLNGDIKARLTNSHLRTGVVGPGTVTVQAYERRDTSLQAVQWFLQATYLGFPNYPSGIQLSNVGQIAIGGSGRILIADTGNDRLVILNSDGSFYSYLGGLTGITGVCVDASNNIYVAYWGGTGGLVRRYTSGFALTHTSGSMTGNHLRHITTDGSTVYATHDGNVVVRFSASDLSYLGPTWGFGVLNIPWGIVYKASTGQVVVVDSGNAQLMRYSTTGIPQSQVSMTAGLRGIALDSGGDEWVAGYADDMAYSTGGDFFLQPNPGSIVFASGDVAWATNVDAGTISTWDEIFSDLAFEYDAALLTAIAIPR